MNNKDFRPYTHPRTDFECLLQRIIQDAEAEIEGRMNEIMASMDLSWECEEE